MAEHHKITLFRRTPLPEVALRQSQAQPVVLDSLASLDADRRVPEVPRWQVLLIAAAIVIGILAGCAPSRPPLPGAELPAELERIDQSVCWHELEVCRWRCQ